MRGLWHLAKETGDASLELFLHNHLDFFLRDHDQFGYRILNNESLTHNDSSIFYPW